MTARYGSLPDAHVHRFIRDGFLVLGLEELGAGFHENVYRAPWSANHRPA